MKYWINTISRDHVQRGVIGGFTQANHGSAQGLKRLHSEDWLVFYSPKTHFQGGQSLQAFTAIGQVTSEPLYQAEVTKDFVAWRRNINFMTCEEAPIKPLIPELLFIKDKAHWGFMFRFGLFEIPEDDFIKIRHAMHVH